MVRCSGAVMNKLTLERVIGVNGFSMAEVLPILHTVLVHISDWFK